MEILFDALFAAMKVGTVFLGYEKDVKRSPVFSAVITSDMHVALREENEEWAWKSVLKEAPKMNELDCGLMGFVNGMMEFHLKNVKCGRTGYKNIFRTSARSRHTALSLISFTLKMRSLFLLSIF